MNDSLRDFIAVYGDDERTLKVDGYDDCIIGMDSKQRLVYDTDMIVRRLSNDMSQDEALEFYYYNIEGSHMGDHTPIYIHRYEKIAECKHLNINHQPEESDTNSTEYRYCEDCGEELPLE